MPELLEHNPLIWLDYLGIAVFAISGALVAAQKKQNFVTFVFFAMSTGVGGGTVRDLLIGAPVFWATDNVALLTCLAGALGVWLLARTPSPPKVLQWFDAVGLAAYAVYGTEKALQYGLAPVPAGFMGILAACSGGIIRDLLAEQPSVLLRPEIYITAAALSAASYSLLAFLDTPQLLAALLAGLVGFGLRAAAIVYGLGLPNHGKA